MNVRLKFLFKVTVISALLYLVSDLLVMGYDLVLLQVYRLFRPQAWPQLLTQGYNSALRTIPFLALLLATPALPIKRRLSWLAGGVLVFVLLDAATTAIWGAPPSQNLSIASTHGHYTWSLIWDTTGHWLLPLLLWIVAAHREIRAVLEPAAASGA